MERTRKQQREIFEMEDTTLDAIKAALGLFNKILHAEQDGKSDGELLNIVKLTSGFIGDGCIDSLVKDIERFDLVYKD